MRRRPGHRRDAARPTPALQVLGRRLADEDAGQLEPRSPGASAAAAQAPAAAALGCRSAGSLGSHLAGGSYATRLGRVRVGVGVG
eukprot:scaffold15299_cov86-Phaeocystis_antarctica.AAC.1